MSSRLQAIASPETEWSAEHQYDVHLRDTTGRPYRETFVQAFSVEEPYRRQGHGKSLQLAALDLSRELGAYQMRSWSSLDKRANYALKLSLGFVVHPAVQKSGVTGQLISGVCFVKVVQPIEA